MNLLDLTETDLVANRQGHLSSRQRDKLKRKRLDIVLGYGLLAMGGIVFLVYALANTSPNSLITAIPAGGLSVIMFGLLIYKGQQIQEDLARNKAVFAEGKVSLRVMETRQMRYKLQLGYLELEIPKRVYQGLNDGKRYRVYYTPKSHTILAIEHTTNNASCH